MTNLFLIFMTLSISLNSLAAEQKHAGHKRKSDTGIQKEEDKKQKHEIDFLSLGDEDLKKRLENSLHPEQLASFSRNGNFVVAHVLNDQALAMKIFKISGNEIYFTTLIYKGYFNAQNVIQLIKFAFSPTYKYFVAGPLKNFNFSPPFAHFFCNLLVQQGDYFVNTGIEIPGIEPHFINDNYVETSEGIYDIQARTFIKKESQKNGNGCIVS